MVDRWPLRSGRPRTRGAGRSGRFRRRAGRWSHRGQPWPWPSTRCASRVVLVRTVSPMRVRHRRWPARVRSPAGSGVGGRPGCRLARRQRLAWWRRRSQSSNRRHPKWRHRRRLSRRRCRYALWPQVGRLGRAWRLWNRWPWARTRLDAGPERLDQHGSGPSPGRPTRGSRCPVPGLWRGSNRRRR